MHNYPLCRVTLTSCELCILISESTTVKQGMCCRYTRGGLIEQAFYIQIANAILPEVTDLLNPFAFLTSHILARYP